MLPSAHKEQLSSEKYWNISVSHSVPSCKEIQFGFTRDYMRPITTAWLPVYSASLKMKVAFISSSALVYYHFDNY